MAIIINGVILASVLQGDFGIFSLRDTPLVFYLGALIIFVLTYLNIKKIATKDVLN